MYREQDYEKMYFELVKELDSLKDKLMIMEKNKRVLPKQDEHQKKLKNIKLFYAIFAPTIWILWYYLLTHSHV